MLSGEVVGRPNSQPETSSSDRVIGAGRAIIATWYAVSLFYFGRVAVSTLKLVQTAGALESANIVVLKVKSDENATSFTRQAF